MKIIKFWGPAVLWMIIIFTLSSRPSVKVSDEGALNFLFFKSLHVIEYAVLYLFNYRALKNTFVRDHQKWFMAAFIITMLYAASDELHQLFVPTREGTVRDVIIDSIGASLIWLFLTKLLPKAPKPLMNFAKNWQLI